MPILWTLIRKNMYHNKELKITTYEARPHKNWPIEIEHNFRDSDTVLKL